ncbi:DEAD/DEAH box helicase [Caldanaerobacter subterraneus]|uniref:DEAD/DEAH box helicase n=1 Tax=Caldanaerobacter subterraneus TaxID=911092 RepID=A0A7Y2L5Z5_9THEO|nr:DEAD/DEAH box helicase [Caldanaerobacter subterraneus]
MYNISVHDYNASIHIDGYCDLYVFDSNDVIHFISLAGFDSTVRGLYAAFLKKRKVKIGYYTYYSADSYHGHFTKIGGYTHAVLLSQNIYDPNSEAPVFLVWDEEEPHKALYNILYTRYSTPLKQEWSKWLYNYLLQHGYIENLFVVGSEKLKAFKIKLLEYELENIITKAIKTGVIKITGENKLDFFELTLTDYLKENANYFAEKINNLFKPLHHPLIDELSPNLKNLLRKPFRAQADAIMGAVKALQNEKGIIFSSEMGTGKTLMGAAVPYVLMKGKPYRALVMCPAHLVEKWKREILNTIPNSEAYILESWEDVAKLKYKGTKKDKIEYYIISRDKSKLGYQYKPSVIYSKSKNALVCPNCGQVLVNKSNIPLTLSDFNKRRKSNSRCSFCNTPLWSADNTGIRRYPPAEYIKRYLKGFFDFFIADEVHELKGDTAQGQVFGMLSSAAKKTIALTGTLSGGYSSNLFYILYRLDPEALKEEGMDYYSITKWIEKYGVIERVTKEKIDTELNKTSKGNKSTTTTVHERPGISPLVLSKHLIDKTIFLELSDLQQELPPYEEYVEIVEMDDDLKFAYEGLAEHLKEKTRELLAKGSRKLLGTYLATLLSYPDRPFDNPPIYAINESGNPELVSVPPELSKDVLYNKEKRLIELIKEELKERRNVFVYAVYTGKKDVTERLKNILNNAGIKAEVLKSSINAEKREEWIKNKISQGAQVIIGNPELVKTGLDLYDFPTLIFYQTGYNLFTLRQASRRSWRIGQDKPVRVIFMAYKDTLQYNALTLMGSKLEAALAIEGKFSEEGLRSLSENNDLTTELAKSLVGGLDTSLSLESIWKKVSDRKEKENMIPNNLVTISSGQIDLFTLISNNAAITSGKDEMTFVETKKTYKVIEKKNKKIAVGQLMFDF